MLMMVNEATLPTGTATEGYFEWYMDYRVSTDGGKTYAVNQQVIQQGGSYSSTNPVSGVTLGTNAMFMGGVAATPIDCTTTLGTKVLVPVQISRSSAGYFDSAVLIGTWTDSSNNATDETMQWNLSQRVVLKSTYASDNVYRGLFEPTVAQIGNKVLIVCRGSNQGYSSRPSYKWYSTSSDGGLTWSSAIPWTYSNGATFYSPSSSSQLLECRTACATGSVTFAPTIPTKTARGIRWSSASWTHDSAAGAGTVVTIDSMVNGDDSSLQL